MGLLDRITTRHRFADGAKISLAHRYALFFEAGDRSVTIGFEQALEPGIGRLIHRQTIRTWQTPSGDILVTEVERDEIIECIKQYCDIKGFTYRVVD